MKCEICHKAEAETVVWRDTGKGQEELYVCSHCAKKQTAKRSSGRREMPRIVIAAPSMDLKEIPPQIIEAFQRMIGESLGEKGGERDMTCPVCGTSLQEALSVGRVGCSSCYSAFPADLLNIWGRRGERSPHCGKTPWSKSKGEGV